MKLTWFPFSFLTPDSKSHSKKTVTLKRTAPALPPFHHPKEKLNAPQEQPTSRSATFSTDPPMYQALCFLRGTNGFPRIFTEGNFYYKHKVSKKSERTFWLCSQYKKTGCNARLTLNASTREVMPRNQEHKHDALFFESSSSDEVELYAVVEFDR